MRCIYALSYLGYDTSSLHESVDTSNSDTSSTDTSVCYDSDNSPVYRGCLVRLRPLAAVFYVRWRPMGAADFTLSWRRFSGN